MTFPPVGGMTGYPTPNVKSATILFPELGTG
jgi:hypothetical protein